MIFDVTEGLWGWRRDHPDWRPGLEWEAPVSSFCATSRAETLVFDALAPDVDAVWARLDKAQPKHVVVLKPDHVRDARLFHDRYDATVYCEMDALEERIGELERFAWTAPTVELPGGVLLLEDGRWRRETPAYLPEQRAVVFADGVMCDPTGVLRIWKTPWHEQRVVPTIRGILETYEIEHVLVAHGDPVHERKELVAALTREPWSGF